MAKGKKGTATTLGEPRTYVLGPQADGSIVLRVGDDFDLMVLRKAVEKQEKNSQAATGTIGALAEGEDPFLDRVQRSLVRLKGVIARSRAPENQIADTPIGKELAAATKAALDGTKGEQIDGKPEGTWWAPHVPTPRPKLGDKVVWPNEAFASEPSPITSIEGWDPTEEAFVVLVFDNTRVRVVAHSPAPGEVVYRVKGANYSDATVTPTAGDELIAATKTDAIDPLLADAPTSSDEEDESTAKQTNDETLVEGTDAAGETRTEAATPKKRATSGSSKQRERNARANGLKGAKKGRKR